MIRSIALALGISALLGADTLGDLKTQLGKFQGGEPVKASLDYQFWRQVTEDKKPTVSQGRSKAQIEDGSEGIKVSWPRNLVQQAQAESKAQAKDPSRTAGTRSALEGLGPVTLSDYLNYADVLLRDFERSQVQVQEERSETWNGKPARLLVLKATPRIPENQRKYIKDIQTEVKLWLGADGLPLAYLNKFHYKGSRFFMSFEGSSSDEYQFTRSGNRLVATLVKTESSQSGMGQVTQRKSTIALGLN